MKEFQDRDSLTSSENKSSIIQKGFPGFKKRCLDVSLCQGLSQLGEILAAEAGGNAHYTVELQLIQRVTEMTGAADDSDPHSASLQT